MIPEEVRQAILTEIGRIKNQENVSIFYACESGSRGWGFESADSDYDVRFFYIHPPEWYLSIYTKPDVIERPIQGVLDISGWDIRKALHLLRKSNPPLLEWLQSPIVYKEGHSITARMRALVPEYYSPRACLYHYLHTAQGNYRKYLKEDPVWVKKYFYVLRPILACRWIEQDRGVVPIEFQKLLDATVDDAALRTAIDDLVARKKKGFEVDRGTKIPAISTFIDRELARLEVANPARPAPDSDPMKLDELFRDALEVVSGAR